jgi:hypothetical protein
MILSTHSSHCGHLGIVAALGIMAEFLNQLDGNPLA